MTDRRRFALFSSRRRWLQAFSLAAAQNTLAKGQTDSGHRHSIDDFRSVSNVFGQRLADERLEAIRPALERQFAQLEAVRRLELDERVEPATLFQASR